MKTKRCLAFMLPAAGLILAAGCDKLTRNHFDMIQLGVHDRYDVEKHIGDADDQLADLWSYERVDKHLNVFIPKQKRF